MQKCLSKVKLNYFLFPFILFLNFEQKWTSCSYKIVLKKDTNMKAPCLGLSGSPFFSECFALLVADPESFSGDMSMQYAFMFNFWFIGLCNYLLWFCFSAKCDTKLKNYFGNTAAAPALGKRKLMNAKETSETHELTINSVTIWMLLWQKRIHYSWSKTYLR